VTVFAAFSGCRARPHYTWRRTKELAPPRSLWGAGRINFPIPPALRSLSRQAHGSVLIRFVSLFPALNLGQELPRLGVAGSILL
jgi:hypothetical protein